MPSRQRIVFQLLFGSASASFSTLNGALGVVRRPGWDDVQNLSRNFLRGWWPHGSGRLVVFEAIEPTEEEATNERG